LALLGVLVLAACTSGDTEGGVTAPPSPPATSETLTAEPTSEPTETGEAVAPPEMPAEARERTAEGAELFATYLFAVTDYAYNSGDIGPLLAIAHDECTSCQSIASEIEASVADGAWFEGVATEVTSAAAPPPDDLGTVVSVAIDEAASRQVASDGSTIDETPGAMGIGADVYLVKTRDGWQVFGIGRAER